MLGEDLALTGTGVSLHYDSKRAVDRLAERRIRVNVTGNTPPVSAIGVVVSTQIAGRALAPVFFKPRPNLIYETIWDGLDAYKRPLQGRQLAFVKVSYVFRPRYAGTNRFGYNGNGTPVTADRARQEFSFSTTLHVPVGAWDAKAQKMGGWTLSNHHAYDFASRTLVLGDGDEWSGVGTASSGARVLATTSPLAEPFGNSDIGGQPMACLPDGNILIGVPFPTSQNTMIARIDRNGKATKFAGGGSPPDGYGDGGLATDAQLGQMVSMTVGLDGTVYFSDQRGGFPTASRIRKIAPNGIISTIAGLATGSGSDGTSALQAPLGAAFGLAAGPDGALYFGDGLAGPVVRKIDPSGLLATVAGNVTATALGDGGPALNALLNLSTFGGAGTTEALAVAVHRDGTLYINDVGHARVRRVGADGRISTVAGGGQLAFGTNGVQATSVTLGSLEGIAVGNNGEVYFQEGGSDASGRQFELLRHLRSDGTLVTIAGGGTTDILSQSSSVGILATLIDLHGSGSFGTPLAVQPDGTILSLGNNYLLAIAPAMPGLSLDNLIVPSQDGSEIYEFDPNGRHLDTRNALTGAITTKFAYTASGLLASETDGDGNVLTIQRNANGDATAIVAPGGQTTALGMDANGYLASATDPGGHAHSFEYSTGGLMLSHTTPNGAANGDYKSTYTYDALGRVTKDADPQGGSLSVSANELTTGVDITLTTAMGRTSYRQIRFLPDGSQLQRLIDPAGATTLLTQGPDGSIAGQLPDGMTTYSTLSADPRWGMQTPLLKSLNVTTPLGVSYNAGSSRTTILTTPGQPLSMSSQTDSVTINGEPFQNRFDAGSRILVSTSAMGHAEQIVLDSHARLASMQLDPAIDPLTMNRNARGQVTQLSQGPERTFLDYDPVKLLLISVSDAQSNQAQLQYAGADLVRLLIAPDGGRFQFDHDPNDNVTGLTMPSGDTHAFDHDKIDQPTTYTPPPNPAVPPQITHYNRDRQLDSVQLPTGRTQAMSFDPAGRPLQLAYPEGTVRIAYAGATDRIQSVSSSVGGLCMTTFAYDGPLPLQMTMSGVVTGQYRYRYDANFQLVGYALDQNPEIAINRDRDGLATQHGPFTYTRNGPAGAVSRISDGTLIIDYTYTSAGRLWTRTHTVAGQQVYRIELSYSNLGQISQKIETTSGVSHTFAYTYDSADRLRQVQVDRTTTEQYQYDGNGNRTSRQLGANPVESATFDGQDRLKTRGSVAYTFNDDGQMTQRGTDLFAYTARGELANARLGGGSEVSYASQGGAQRATRTNGADTLQYLYALGAGSPTATRSSAGVITQLFYDGFGSVIAFQRGGNTSYVATDQVGSPRVFTDTAGAVVREITYDSFGVVISDSSPSFEFPLGFAGGLADPASGLVRFGFRDYEPASGRWTAKDPIGLAGGFNRYEYAASDPVNKKDILGLWVNAVFDVRAGTFTVTDFQTGKVAVAHGVVSGNGSFANDPASQGVRDGGPLPLGDYIIGMGYHHGRDQDHPGDDWWYRLYGDNQKGGYDYRRIPVKNALGEDSYRGLFNLHTGLASNGCITVPSQVPQGGKKGKHKYPWSSEYNDIKKILDNTVPIVTGPGKGTHFTGFLVVQ